MESNLSGNYLLHMPQSLWAFTKADFSFGETGTRTVVKDGFFLKRVEYQSKNRIICKSEFLFEKSIISTVEFVYRRILGSLATVVSFATLAPIGFVAILIHRGIRASGVKRIWNDSSLLGHSFTSLVSKCYQFTTMPLHWHLLPDGSDRRAHIITWDKNGEKREQKAEYQLVPFELFEFCYRRILGGAVLLGAGALSPIGLAAKAVHLSAQKAFYEEKLT